MLAIQNLISSTLIIIANKHKLPLSYSYSNSMPVHGFQLLPALAVQALLLLFHVYMQLNRGVCNRWTGELDWSTGLEHWTGALEYWSALLIGLRMRDIDFSACT